MPAPARRSPAVNAALATVIIFAVLANVFAGLDWAARAMGGPSPLPEHVFLDAAGIARLAAFLGIVVVVGAWSAVVVVLPQVWLALPSSEDAVRRISDEAWQVGRAAAWLLLAGVTARAIFQIATLIDPMEAPTLGWLGTVVFDTTLGKALQSQVVAALLVVAAWRQDRRPGAGAVIVAGIACVMAAVAESTAGHGMAGRWAGAVGVGLHAIHLLGVGAWLGSLALVLLLLLPGTADRRLLLRQALAGIAPVGLGGASLTIATGALMGLEYAGGLRALLSASDAWQRLLLVKLAVVLAIGGLGFVHWQVAVPRLGDTLPAATRRTLLLEIALAGVVLLLSAVLVALPAAGV